MVVVIINEWKGLPRDTIFLTSQTHTKARVQSTVPTAQKPLCLCKKTDPLMLFRDIIAVYDKYHILMCMSDYTYRQNLDW
jgi:hypothetical protein